MNVSKFGQFNIEKIAPSINLTRPSFHIMHIDFGEYCFEASMNREKFPEKVRSNVFKPDPDTEPDDLSGYWVTGSTTG
ncbi:hypothetical protein YC2023_043670 [Brassica napus]